MTTTTENDSGIIVQLSVFLATKNKMKQNKERKKKTPNHHWMRVKIHVMCHFVVWVHSSEPCYSFY